MSVYDAIAIGGFAGVFLSIAYFFWVHIAEMRRNRESNWILHQRVARLENFLCRKLGLENSQIRDVPSPPPPA